MRSILIPLTESGESIDRFEGENCDLNRFFILADKTSGVVPSGD